MVQLIDGSNIIVEVKGENLVDNEVMKVKATYALQLAIASNMQYRMIKGIETIAGVGFA